MTGYADSAEGATLVPHPFPPTPYLYSQGVFRTASERYSPYDLDNVLSHLTNHCVQEMGPNFSKFEVGNEMWYGEE